MAQIEAEAQWFLACPPRVIKLCQRQYDLSEGLSSLTSLQSTQMTHLGLMCLMPLILLPTLTVKVKGNKLWCSATYISIDSYCQESESLLDHNFHLDFLEEIPNFSVLQRSPHISASSPLQYYLAIEKPNLTLDCVVDGMQKKKNKEDYHNNEDMGNH